MNRAYTFAFWSARRKARSYRTAATVDASSVWSLLHYGIPADALHEFEPQRIG